jgi:hypothetical protein
MSYFINTDKEFKITRNMVMEKHHDLVIDIVIHLMNIVHQDVLCGTSTDYFNYNDKYSKILNDSLTSVHHLCSGLAYIFAIALTSFGIPVRLVCLFDSTESACNNHATTEVLVNGKWIAADPSFNVMFTDSNGCYLGYTDLLTTDYRVKQFPTQPGRSLKEYYMPIEPYLNYIYIQSTNISKEIVYPEKWDAKIDNKTIKVLPHNGWYKLVRIK